MKLMLMWRGLGFSVLCALVGWAPPAFAMGKAASAPVGTEVLVVPARYTTLQVGFDVISRAGAVLVAYQGDASTGTPGLHVWNGLEWVPISADDFGDGSYVRAAPGRIVLVGDDETLPANLVDTAMGVSSAKVLQISTQDTADLLNALGTVYDFSADDWNWYADRYKLDLSDANQDLRQISFYDQPIVGRPVWPWSRERTAPARLGPMEEEPPPSAPVVEEELPDISAEPAAAMLELPPTDWEERAVADDAPIK